MPLLLLLLCIVMRGCGKNRNIDKIAFANNHALAEPGHAPGIELNIFTIFDQPVAKGIANAVAVAGNVIQRQCATALGFVKTGDGVEIVRRIVFNDVCDLLLPGLPVADWLRGDILRDNGIKLSRGARDRELNLCIMDKSIPQEVALFCPLLFRRAPG